MTTSAGDYEQLIRAAGSKDPVTGVLRSLVDRGATWASVITTGGRPIDSAGGTQGRRISAEVIERAFARVVAPLSQEVRVRDTDGELLAIPVGAESVAIAVLLISADESIPGELARFSQSAATLLRLHLGHRRRLVTASRMVRDSVTRLVFAGRLDSAFELAAEMGLAAPPSRPHVVCICGLADWDRDDILDLLESALPISAQQVFGYNDEDECWLLLSAPQFQALNPELTALLARDPVLKVLLTEQVPIAKVAHRWRHWAADIRNAPVATIVDRSLYRGDTPSDLVHRLQQECSPQVVEAVIEYLRNRGRWEAAADSLGIHRNTLRYRVAVAEKLLGVDLTQPTPASRVWLALRTEGLVAD